MLVKSPFRCSSSQKPTPIAIPANSTVKLTPGGLHLMMSQPKPLAKGDAVELVLTFERSGTKTVRAKVIDDISEVLGS